MDQDYTLMDGHWWTLEEDVPESSSLMEGGPWRHAPLTWWAPYLLPLLPGP